MQDKNVTPPAADELAAPKVRLERSAPLHAELILVGRDLLRGHLADGNAKYIAGYVSSRGGMLQRITVVDDAPSEIAGAIRESLGRNPHLVVTTGGLGPAADDHTLAAVAEALSRPLTASAVAKDMVEKAYRERWESKVFDRGGTNAVRAKLFQIPVNGTPLSNPLGVVPGLLARVPGGAAVLCLPGTPRETRAVLEQAAPELRDLAPRRELARREIESPSADESAMRPFVDQVADEFPRVWISTRPIGSGRKGTRVLVHLETTATSAEEANQIVSDATNRLLALARGSR